MSRHCPPPSRSFVLRALAIRKRRGQKQIGGAVGMSQAQVSYHLARPEIDAEDFEQLLAGIGCTDAEVAVVTGCAESLEALERPSTATPEERTIIEMAVLEMGRLFRKLLTSALEMSRSAAAWAGYPLPGSVEPERGRAREQLALLKGVPDAFRARTARVLVSLHDWAMVELIAEESVQAASRDIPEAFQWARIARWIASRVRSQESWRKRLNGFALAAFANVLRVAGRLNAADRTLEAAKLLWNTGSDPDRILDPGRLLDLEASLRRAQRRFGEALDLLDQARAVSRCPARILINKGFTLEAMGEHRRAIAALQEAEPLLERENDPRLRYTHRFNLAVSESHLGNFAEGGRLAGEARELARRLGDRIFLVRVLWLEGRIAAGQGRSAQALQWLEEAEKELAARKMWYDVALALLERAALLLQEGRVAEARAASRGLVAVFEAEGVHREALAALRLFHEAAQSGTATADLARNVLQYLFRARWDEEFPFSS